MTDDDIIALANLHGAVWVEEDVMEIDRDGLLALVREAYEAGAGQYRQDAERWRKCKTMTWSWWLDAMTEAGMPGGRSLDAAIDAARGKDAADPTSRS